MYKFPKYATHAEQVYSHKLVKAILQEGNSISVWEGEEWSIKKSTNKLDIVKAMGSTGEDVLRVRNSNGDILGNFYLIFDGTIGDGLEVISDYSDNDYCNRIYNSL